jgi:hypothetical protein
MKLQWTKIDAESTRVIECITCPAIKLDAGEHGYFVRYVGKSDIYYTYERPCNGGALENWYIDGRDIFVKHQGEPFARQHIGVII